MRFFCCCQGNTPCGTCPARPADFATRDYRVFIPAVVPGQFGKPVPPFGGNTCASNLGFDHGYCDVHEPAGFQYVFKNIGWCPPDTGAVCYEGLGPYGAALGGVTSANIVPWFPGPAETGQDPANPFNRTMTVLETPGGGAPYETRVLLGLTQRCDVALNSPCSGSCVNRMTISVGWQWAIPVAFTQCGTTNNLTLLMSKGGTYVSDPYVGAFPETLYLKSASIRPAYVPPTWVPGGNNTCGYPNQDPGQPGDFYLPSPCPLSYQPGGQLSVPFDLPTTISIQRYA